MTTNLHYENPCAAKPFLSYRYRLPYGELFTGKMNKYIMIGAKNNLDAVNEVKRSMGENFNPDLSNLEMWDGEKYTSIEK